MDLEEASNLYVEWAALSSGSVIPVPCKNRFLPVMLSPHLEDIEYYFQCYYVK